MNKRVHAYMHQETLFREKIRFLLNMQPVGPQHGLDIGSSAGGLSVAMTQRGGAKLAAKGMARSKLHSLSAADLIKE
jgi:predicted rRNA methylase YqxC with S4 and FtsJ domains